MSSLNKDIELNEQLINLESFTEGLNYFTNYLKSNFSIENFFLSIKKDTIYNNIEEYSQKELDTFEFKINSKDKIIFKYPEALLKNISKDNFKIQLKTVSQTIYSKYLEKKLNEIDIKDNLTGLYNRNYIFEYLRTIIPLANRENKKLAFLKIGIDHFKAVIDEFNYDIGDEVIKELSLILKNSIRSSDVIARFDSDEFLVILHNVSNENNAIMIAKKLINNFKEAKVIIDKDKNQSLMKTICTGILICPDDADKINDIIRSTDVALYEAKNLGRGMFYKFKKDDNSIELF